MMNPDSKNARPGTWTVSLALLTALIGVALSLFLYSRIARSEETEARLTAEALQARTETELNRFADVLESVRALHALSGKINQAAMDEFIEKGLVHQQTVLGAFGLAQKIDPPLRMDIEQKPKGQPGAYDVVQRAPDGTWIPASNRSFYYPLTWQSRTDALQIPVGYDFASTAANRRTILQIEKTRRTTVVREAIRFSENTDPAYWVFSPVIPNENLPMVIGLAVAILHPDQILQHIEDRDGLASSLRLEPFPANLLLSETVRLSGTQWIYQGRIHAAGTDWLFESHLPASNRRSFAALAVGLVITALMTVVLLLLAGRTRRIEAEVFARTEDLQVANARLEENIRERAQLEEEMNELSAKEQRRIGRDLHDSLGQKLTGAAFLSRALFNHFKNDDGELHTHAKTLNETLKDSVSQVRKMARGLASVTLNDESLEESLHQLTEEMGALYDIPCELKQNGPLPPLDRKTKEQLYFIAREAVNNAARHANAGRITVELTGDSSKWKLRVKDDGEGLSENNSGGEGMGLRIMRHRANRIGAEFSIQSVLGKGTTIEVTSNAGCGM